MFAVAVCASPVAERVYLSGKGPSDAVEWDFFCSKGRKSGEWTKIPVLKISSNNPLAQRKKNWIDFNAGALMAEADLHALADDLFDRMLEIASGAQTCNEHNDSRDFAIWKSGVTL